jgi:hypothetical protein
MVIVCSCEGEIGLTEEIEGPELLVDAESTAATG